MTFASGARGMGFKSRVDQISHALLTTRQSPRCNFDVWTIAVGEQSSLGGGGGGTINLLECSNQNISK